MLEPIAESIHQPLDRGTGLILNGHGSPPVTEEISSDDGGRRRGRSLRQIKPAARREERGQSIAGIMLRRMGVDQAPNRSAAQA
jgi:hypothetical protein